MEALHLTTETFDATLIGPEPVLVDFWATWCGPCRMIAPVIEALAEEYDGKAKICKVDVDENSALAERFQVMTIPTVMIFKNGQIIEKSIGAKSKEAFMEMLDKHL